MPTRRLLADWLPLALLAVACYQLSCDQFRAAETHRTLRTLLAPWSPTDATVDLLNTILRRGGHFFGYATLAFCLARALRSHPPGPRLLATAGLVLLWCGLDEYHQSLTRYREGSVHDMLLDLSGAGFALGGMTVLSRLRGWEPGPQTGTWR